MDLCCTVIHALPGRCRLKIAPPISEPGLLEAITRSLPGVVSASYSAPSQTFLIYHIYRKFPPSYLNKIRQFLGACHPLPEADNETKKLAVVAATLALEKLIWPAGKMGIAPSSVAVLWASRSIIFNGFKTIFKPTPDTLTTASLLALIYKKQPV